MSKDKKVFGSKKDDSYRGTGVDTSTVETVAGVAGLAANAIPGGGAVAQLGTAGVQVAAEGLGSDASTEKTFHELDKAGVDVADDPTAKHNKTLKKHVEKVKHRNTNRIGKAASSGIAGAGGAIAGTAVAYGSLSAAVSGGAAVQALTPMFPGAGFVLGAAGGLAAGYVGGKAWNALSPDERADGVDLTVEIVKAQKQGMEIPPEVVFAQWAQNQEGPVKADLTKRLKHLTGTGNFADAVNEGKLNEISQLMNDPKSRDLMTANMGLAPDSRNPNRHVADQLSEWLNSGNLHAKDLLLKKNLPMGSLADAEMDGMVPSEPVIAPNVGLAEMHARNRSAEAASMSLGA